MTIKRIAVRGIIWRDGKLFLQKNTHRSGKVNNFWSLPGGKLEDSENLVDGLKRELLEECGVDAQIGRLLFVQQFTSDMGESLEFFFNVDNPEDFYNANWRDSEMAYEIHDADWFKPIDVNLRPDFLRDINGEFIQNGETKYINFLDGEIHNFA